MPIPEPWFGAAVSLIILIVRQVKALLPPAWPERVTDPILYGLVLCLSFIAAVALSLVFGGITDPGRLFALATQIATAAMAVYDGAKIVLGKVLGLQWPW